MLPAVTNAVDERSRSFGVSAGTERNTRGVETNPLPNAEIGVFAPVQPNCGMTLVIVIAAEPSSVNALASIEPHPVGGVTIRSYGPPATPPLGTVALI